MMTQQLKTSLKQQLTEIIAAYTYNVKPYKIIYKANDNSMAIEYNTSLHCWDLFIASTSFLLPQKVNNNRHDNADNDRPNN